MSKRQPNLENPCPACGAKSGERCMKIRRKDGTRSFAKWEHSERFRPVKSEMPDRSAWWKAMAIFEGQYARKRPDWLTV
jgi:hypothetical protein